MPKVIDLKDGTTFVVKRAGDGRLQLHVYTEREASEQHLDVHTRESAMATIPVDGGSVGQR